MANIQDYLTKILKERYGKDVRQSIHDAIQQCYLDGKAGSIDLQARESIEALESEKLDKSGDTANNITVFSSGDNLSPTGWANIEKIESGETHASLFRKFSLAVKNIRYLYKMLGTTDISAIGDGTVTGAISGLNNGISTKLNITHITATKGVTYTIKLSLALPCLVMCTGTSGGSVYLIGNYACNPIIESNNFVVTKIDGNTFTVKQTFNTSQQICILHSPSVTITYE